MRDGNLREFPLRSVEEVSAFTKRAITRAHCSFSMAGLIRLHAPGRRCLERNTCTRDVRQLLAQS